MRAVFTTQALYLSAKCHDTDTSKLTAMATELDGPVWSDDSIGFFINPEDKV